MEGFNFWDAIVGAIVVVVPMAFTSGYFWLKSRAASTETLIDDKIVEMVDKIVAEINKKNET